MMKLTLAIVGETLFQQDITGDAQAVGAAMETLNQNFRRLLSPFAPLLDRLPTAENRRLRHSQVTLDRIVAHLIEIRRQQGDGSDLLSLLLSAHEGGVEGQPMSDRQIRDEVLTLMLAGHETTANALTLTWWLLAQQPAVARKLQHEVDQVLQGRLPTMADVEQLRYTRMVLSEAMRLYPPAWIVGRQALVDHEVGGYPIPAGATVLTSQWVMQFPCGGGSRVCIGEHFAWMEGILLLATLAQQWQMQPLAATPPALRAGVTLRPRAALPMVVQRRSDLK